MSNEIKIDRLLSRAKVMEITGLSYTSIYRWMKTGNFPKSRQVGENTVSWFESEINDWMKNLPIAESSK